MIGFVVATVTGTLAALPVYVMGLAVPTMLIWPLTLGAAALVAALVAGLFGNIVDAHGMRTRLLAVVGVVEGTAVLLVLASALTLFVHVGAFAWPAVHNLVAVSAVLALVTTVATRRWRGSGGSWTCDALMTLALLLLVPPLMYGATLAACATVLRCVP